MKNHKIFIASSKTILKFNFSVFGKTVSEEIIALFEKAIGKSRIPWTQGEKEFVMRRVRHVLTLLKEGKIGVEDAYYALVGIAYEHTVPMSPGDLARLKQFLGLSS